MRRFIVMLLAPAVMALAPTVCVRNGNQSDELVIATTLLVNPFDVSGERFVVALENNRRVGWAQIRPLGTNRRDPSTYNSQPGSYDLESDVDDFMWEALEEEDTVVPNGFSSLPWTPEYRAFANAAKARRERRQEILERERRLSEQSGIWELASLYVDPKYRGQGIGTELVQRTMRRHLFEGRLASNVYLLTPAATTGWFQNVFGFEPVAEKDVPAKMSRQINAGKFVSRFASSGEQQVCCMRGVDADHS